MKTITHFFAAVVALAVGFFSTDAGRAVLAQYPHAAAIITGVLTIAAIYYHPKKTAPAGGQKLGS